MRSPTVIVVFAAMVVGCGPRSSAVESSAPRMKGTKIESRGKNVELVVPEGWVKVVTEHPDYINALLKRGKPEVAQAIANAAANLDLVAMDLKATGKEIPSYLTLASAGRSEISKDSDLDAIYSAMQTSMAPAKLQRKSFRFPVGLCLCVWGTVPQGQGFDSDIIAYAFSGGGEGFVLTFVAPKGKGEAIRELSESVMQTVETKE